jgi:hypothetical protein
MRVYISAYIQFSIFSSGQHVCAVQFAHELRSLGHEVALVNILENGATWFDDCKEIAIPVIQRTACKEKADLFIDIIGCTTAEERAALAHKTVLFIRQPPLHQELENVVYPAATMKRTYDGISEIWTFDFFNRNDYVMLGLLGRCPVRTLPFIWSPVILDAYCKEASTLPWFATAKALDETHLRVCETNVGNRSNCTLPLVIMREYLKRERSLKPTAIHVSNAKQLLDRKYFMENILKHIDIQPQPQLLGRSRLPDWCMNPRSFIVAHERFQPVRWAYLDAAYMGIPMVHNSELLKMFGGELEKYYYPNNQVGQAADKLGLLLGNAVEEYTDQALGRTRYVLVNGLTIRRDSAKGAWTKALSEVGPAVPVLPPLDESMLLQPISKAAKEPATAADVPADPPNIFRVQFVGMWENFQPDYNFFTLMLTAYFKEASMPEVQVIGCGPEYLGIPSLRVLGPFGCSTPVRMGVPTVFTTSENNEPLKPELCKQNNIQLQLGFCGDGPTYMRLPLWLMSINWFGANNDRLVNPRVMPLEACIKPHKKVEREKFCAFVVTNSGNPYRNAALDIIGTLGHVDSAGRYKNNVGGTIFAGAGGGGGEEKKVKFLEDYRWNITYENSMGEGYVTEKLFHAKVAGSIPIYWGSEAVNEDFNADGFINATSMTEAQLIERIRYLESVEGASERRQLAQTPLFADTKVQQLRERLAAIAHRMVGITEFTMKPATQPAAIGIKTGQEIIARKVYGRSY